MTRLLQYAKSTDPDVLAVVRHNTYGAAKWRRRAIAWGKERGGESICRRGFGHYFVVGLLSDSLTDRGRWTLPNSNGVRRPYKTNTAEHEALESLRFDVQATPGLPYLLLGEPESDWSQPSCTPQPFVRDGIAWHGTSFMPVETSNSGEFGPQWIEVKASEYYAACEAVVEAES